MQNSKIVEVDGIFIGAAVLLPDSQGWRFVSADIRAHDADGCVAPTLYAAQMIAKRAFVTSKHRQPWVAESVAVLDAAVA